MLQDRGNGLFLLVSPANVLEKAIARIPGQNGRCLEAAHKDLSKAWEPGKYARLRINKTNGSLDRILREHHNPSATIVNSIGAKML